jgi:hypothetical protein
VNRFVASVTSSQPDEARRFIESYRGIALDAEVLQSFQLRANARPPSGTLSAHPITTTAGANRTYFRQTRDRDACRPFAPGRVIRVYELTSCCDGDPGAPCLLRGGITRGSTPSP